MESARDKYTKEIVEAEDLWMLTHVDRNGYECSGCEQPVYPASYLKTNLKRPHFSLFPKTDHLGECDVDGERKTVASGRKGSVRNELETSPGLSPSKLILKDERTAVDATLPSSSTLTVSKSTTRTNSNDGATKPAGRRPSNTIRPICRAFINFPYDRNMSLDIPGIEDKTYLTAFKKLGAANAGIEHFARSKVFYAELAWAKAQATDDSLVIKLSAGEWNAERQLVRKYMLRICWSQWSKYKRTKVQNEMEVVREEGIKEKKSKSKKRAYAFFIGEQDEQDPTYFNVTDHRLICGLVGELSW